MLDAATDGTDETWTLDDGMATCDACAEDGDTAEDEPDQGGGARILTAVVAWSSLEYPVKLE